MMPFRRPIPTLAAALTLAVATAASAQTVLPHQLRAQGFEQLEPAVEDVEPLRTGLRQLQWGLGPEGLDSKVYRHPDDPNGRIYVVLQGITASYDRSQYLRIDHRDGETEVKMLTPPNTIFHIGPPPVPRPVNTEPNPARIDDQVYHGPYVRSADRTQAVDVDRERELTQWMAYSRLRGAVEEGVMEALDRALN